MKHHLLAAAVLAGTAFAIPATVLAQSSDQKTQQGEPSEVTTLKGPVVGVEVTSISGKVTAIDRADRQVAIEGDDGRKATLFVGPHVRNFDNLKLGDDVTMRYTETVSMALAKGGIGTESKLGEIRTKVQADAARQAPPGGKPGFTAMERTTLVANVYEIDRKHGILTLRGTDGVPVEIKVPDKDALANIKLDDQVVLGFREAAALSIEPGDSATASTATPADDNAASGGSDRSDSSAAPKQ